MTPSRPARRPADSSKRAAVFVIAAGIAVLVAVNQSAGPARPPEPARLDRMSARTLSAHVSVTGPVGAARAAEAWLARANPPTPPVPPAAVAEVAPPAPPRLTAAVRVTQARSVSPHEDRDGARLDAAAVAAAAIGRQLAGLDAPVSAAVTPALVLERYVKPAAVRFEPVTDPDARAELAARNLNPDRVYAVLDAEVSPAEVRRLRAEGRSVAAARAAGMALVGLAAGLAFLRLDGATKGYLTWGLGLGLAGAAAGAIAALAYFV